MAMGWVVVRNLAREYRIARRKHAGAEVFTCVLHDRTKCHRLFWGCSLGLDLGRQNLEVAVIFRSTAMHLDFGPMSHVRIKLHRLTSARGLDGLIWRDHGSQAP